MISSEEELACGFIVRHREARLISRDSGNLHSSIVADFRTILSRHDSNPTQRMAYHHQLLSFCERIFKGSLAPVFFYFCIHGAATSWTLQCELNLPESTVYRVIRQLRAMGVIESALRASKNERGGPRPTVWAITDCTKEQIARAMQHHKRMLSPKYRVAEEVAQTILEDYIQKRQVEEISFREVINLIKDLRTPFKASDIAELTADCLSDRGIKVWR